MASCDEFRSLAANLLLRRNPIRFLWKSAA